MNEIEIDIKYFLLEVRTELELNVWVTTLPALQTESLVEIPLKSQVEGDRPSTIICFVKTSIKSEIWAMFFGWMIVLLMRLQQVQVIYDYNWKKIWLDPFSLSNAHKWLFLKVTGITVKHAKYCLFNVCQ